MAKQKEELTILENIKVSATFPAAPEVMYKAWLSSKEHSAMTGSVAKISMKGDKEFTAWDGYITGNTIETVKNCFIVQNWRTSEFPETAEDSLLAISFEPVAKGTRVVLVHQNLPEGSSDAYKQGWKQFYFKPMKAYFK